MKNGDLVKGEGFITGKTFVGTLAEFDGQDYGKIEKILREFSDDAEGLDGSKYCTHLSPFVMPPFRKAIGPKPEPTEGPLAPTPWTVDVSGMRVVLRDANGAQIATVNGTALSRTEDVTVANAIRDLVNGGVADAPSSTRVPYLIDGGGDYWFELDRGYIMSDAGRDEPIDLQYRGSLNRKARGDGSPHSRADVARIWKITEEGVHVVE